MNIRRVTRLLIGLAVLGALFVLFRHLSPRDSAALSTAIPSRTSPQPSLAAKVEESRLAGAVPGLVRSATGARHARAILGSDWGTEAQSVFTAFRDWTGRYLASDIATQAQLLAEGADLARARRTALKELIQTDPRSALTMAVPMSVRQRLPAEIVALLEERVNGHGELALNAVTPVAGTQVAEPTFRSALIGRQEYRAHVFGRRAAQASLTSASLVGIAIDRSLAVSESPLRLLETGESAGDRRVDPVCPISGNTTEVAPGAEFNLTALVAVEYDGKINVLCEPDHVAQLEQRLIANERTGDAGDNQPGSSTVTGRPAQTWTHGTKKLLIIRVDFSDLPGGPLNKYDANAAVTPDYIVNVISGSGQIAAFFAQSSFGKTALQIAATAGGTSPDVTPVLRLPATAASYALAGANTLLHSDARAAAALAGYAPDGYDRVGVVFSYIGPSAIPGSLITYGGLGNVIGKNFWVNAAFDFRVVAHELGHTYGLRHSNLWQVTDGNPASPSGTSVEYGDIFDVMGDGDFPEFDFSHWNKSILQWLPDSGITLASTSGTYRIYRFDLAANANLANPRALKIVRDNLRDYWIGYRRGTTNASLDGGAYVIWGYNANQEGDLLDMATPGTSLTDAGLRIGSIFNDSAAGITLAPLAQGGTGTEEWLDVQVTLSPRVQWSHTTYSIDERGGTALLTLTRAQSGAGSVSVNYATLAGTAASPADFSTQSGTVTWAGGDITDKTIAIPVAPDAVVEGTETFTVALSNPSGAVVGNGGIATVSIVDAGVRDTTFVADFVNNTVEKILPLPDGSMLLGGWFSLVQDAGFASYNRRGVVRLTAAGVIDTSFAADGGSSATPVHDLARQPDGRIIAVGNFTAFNNVPRNRITRLQPDGSVDASFNPGTGADGTIYAVLVQPDGKILIGGGFTSYNGTSRKYLARLNADGSLDSTFVGPNFGGTSGRRVESLALQPDGKLLAGGDIFFIGTPFKAGICRVLTSGAVDPTFSGVTDGAHLAGVTNTFRTVSRIAVQPDGSLLIAGTFTAFNNTARGGLARLTSTGALDATYAPTSNGECYAILPLPDGSAIVGGAFTTLNNTAVSRIARLSSTGTLDAGFIAAGGLDDTVKDLALLPGGRVLIGGSHALFQNSDDTAPLWRMVAGLDGLPGTVQFAGATAIGGEGGTATLSVTRTGGSRGAITVGYSTVPSSATNDFTPTSGVLTWADGESGTKTISVPLAADALDEPVESFTVNLGEPLVGPALLGTIQQAQVSIVDLPAIAAQPTPATVPAGGSVNLTVTATGIGTLTYQWKKNGVNIPGATAPTLSFMGLQVGDSGSYTVAISNAGGTTTSNPVQLTVTAENPATASHAMMGSGYVSGGTVTITNTITYTGVLSKLSWHVLLPTGWNYVGGGGSEGQIKPTVGATNLAEWSWTTFPSSPVTFTYTLNVPAGTSGPHALAALVKTGQWGGDFESLALPDPLIADQLGRHSADTNGDNRLSLLELTRVIQLYNTRNGTVRTGAYKNDAAGEDGFNTDATRTAGASVTLPRYHAGDTQGATLGSARDGGLNLLELTRVIELYNYRSGTVRTGQYHVQAGTEDGFAPGP